MSQSSSWTIGQLLEWTTDYLQKNGSTSARLDAEVLLAHARGCERIELYTAFKELAEESLREQFRGLVKRRADGTPVAYLVGVREFYSMTFRVTPAVLIPRPESEFLVVALFDLVKQSGQQADSLRIADVGTGSGNLACSVAAHLPQANVLAIDLQEDALQVARDNAARHNLVARIQFAQSDLFAEIDPELKFDYVVSNPPYIGHGERSTLPRDVVDQEPHSALFAGPTGLEVVDRLLDQCGHRLTCDGWLICEISPIIADRALALAQHKPTLHRASLVDDLSKQPRVLKVQRRCES